MSTTKEPAVDRQKRILAVDWQRAEEEGEESYDDEARERIERGNISDHPNDRRPYHHLFGNAQFVHPNVGPLSHVYVPFSSKSYLLPAFRKANGLMPYARGVGRQIEELDAEAVCDVVPDLARAAEELAESYDGWYEGRHPIVEADGVGRSPLDKVFIRCALPTAEAASSLPVEDLPIDLSSGLIWDGREDGHCTLIFKHESCGIHPADAVFEPVSEYAAHAGVLDMRHGTHIFGQLRADRQETFDGTEELHDSIKEPSVLYDSYLGDFTEPLPPLEVFIREHPYQREDGSYLWALEWTESAIASDLNTEKMNHHHVYLFEGRLYPAMVEAALVIHRHQQDEHFGTIFDHRLSASEVNHHLMELSHGETVNLTFGSTNVKATVSEPADYRSPELVDGAYEHGGFRMRFTPIESDWWSWMEDSWKVSDIDVSAEKRREWTSAAGWVTRFPNTDSEKTVPLGEIWDVEPIQGE